MNNKEIDKLTATEVDDELFRELIQWEKKDLVIHIIEEMNRDDKRDWIFSYFQE